MSCQESMPSEGFFPNGAKTQMTGTFSAVFAGR